MLVLCTPFYHDASHLHRSGFCEAVVSLLKGLHESGSLAGIIVSSGRAPNETPIMRADTAGLANAIRSHWTQAPDYVVHCLTTHQERKSVNVTQSIWWSVQLPDLPVQMGDEFLVICTTKQAAQIKHCAPIAIQRLRQHCRSEAKYGGVIPVPGCIRPVIFGQTEQATKKPTVLDWYYHLLYCIFGLYNKAIAARPRSSSSPLS